MSARMMILGLDGVSWRVTQQMVSEGRIPTLGRLIKEGAAGPLYSTIPAISPTAWASFMTGKNPGQHGVYGFGLKIPGSYFLEPFSSRGRVQSQSLWGILSSRGKRVAVINVPMTYPPEPVNGVLIAGFGTPDESSNKFVYPENYMDPLREKLGQYILDLNWVEYDTKGISALLEDAHKMTRNRTDYGKHILAQENWDLYMLCYVITDRLQHCLWQYIEPARPLSAEEQKIRRDILDFYDFLDSCLKEVIDASPQSSVMVMSDHGFGHFNATINLNNWASDHGFLTWRAEAQPSKVRFAVKVGRRLGLNRKMFQKVADSLGMDSYKAVEKLSSRSNAIDWTKTRAFSFCPDGFYFNLKGRERDGIVEPGAEADRLFDEIKEKLLELRDPETGKKVIYKIERPEKVYSGSKLKNAPDLVVTESDARYTLMYNLSRTPQIFVRSKWRSGNHDPEGIVIVKGAEIAPRRIERADLIDLAPTALHLLGEAVPMEMDGRTISELAPGTEPELVRTAAAGAQDAPEELLSAEEREMVFERLKGLGYFE